jgi:hypothetical protein
MGLPDEKWQKVRKIFEAAMRCRPEDRQKVINEACGEDKSVRGEVESLLSSHDSADSFMETPAIARVAAVIEAEKKLDPRKGFCGSTTRWPSGGDVFRSNSVRLRLNEFARPDQL